MSTGLRDLLGLPEATASSDDGASEMLDEFRQKFRDVIQQINESQQASAAHAPLATHGEMDAKRSKLIAAYQQTLGKMESGGDGKAAGDADRVIAAGEALGGKAAEAADQAQANHKEWSERQADFDDASAKVAELEDAGHAKASVLRRLVDAVSKLITGRDYAEALSAFEKMRPKIAAIYADASPEGGALPSKRTVEGGGGYVYEQHADGAIFIVKSPRAGNKRTRLKEGGKGHNAVREEIGPFPTTGAPAERPAGAGDASPVLDALFATGGSMLDAASELIDDVADLFGIGGDDPPAQGPPAPATAKSPELMGGAETETEKKLAEFTESMKSIEVEVDGKNVSVRPPYHWNTPGHKIRTDAEAARKNNPKVAKLLKRVFGGDNKAFGSGATVGKATPEQMQKFLEESLKEGLIKDKTAKGMKDYLDEYGVSTDCSGLAVQAINFLSDGDLVRGGGELIDAINTGTGTIKGWTKVKKPSELRAGDAMVKKGHVRIITDVDATDGGVEFTTLESTTGKIRDVDEDLGSGVGERRWRFPDASKFAEIESDKNGEFKRAKGDDKYVYTRHDSRAEKSE